MRTGTTAPPVLTDIFTNYTVSPGGCWLWGGATWPNGYGKLGRKAHGTRLAHRAFYLASGREIPEGFDLDHVWERGCRSRRCVNPEHLEPVTRAVNLRRGFDAKSVCGQGHDLTDPANVRTDARGSRFCVACWRIRYKAAGARYRARQRGEAI